MRRLRKLTRREIVFGGKWALNIVWWKKGGKGIIFIEKYIKFKARKIATPIWKYSFNCLTSYRVYRIKKSVVIPQENFYACTCAVQKSWKGGEEFGEKETYK
jgi:hypothetical protein